jgi:hypothetical protein
MDEVNTEQIAAANGMKVVRLQAIFPHFNTGQIVMAARLADWDEALARTYLHTLTPAAIEGRLRIRANTAADKLSGFFNAPIELASPATQKRRATQELIAEMNLQASEYDREGNHALYAQLANVANIMQHNLNATTKGEAQ